MQKGHSTIRANKQVLILMSNLDKIKFYKRIIIESLAYSSKNSHNPLYRDLILKTEIMARLTPTTLLI